MTGFKSKKAAALDEDGMYLVHQTAQQEQGPDVVMHWGSATWTIYNPPPKGSDNVNLYYAAQRPWVGLSSVDFNDFNPLFTAEEAARWADAKLRSKNT
jgi:hypothetical protein